jgi:hypothetical protein
LEEAKQRKTAVLLRAQRACTEGSLDAAASEADTDSIFELLARLEAKMDAIEIDLTVARELSDEAVAASGRPTSEGAGEFAALPRPGHLAKTAPHGAEALAKTNVGTGAIEGPRFRDGAARQGRTKR